AQPFLDHFKLDGFYECAESASFVVDTCDWEYRTAWDEVNDTGNRPPTPRSFFAYYNTQYLDVPMDTFTIIQEGFWTDETVPNLWVMLDATPIDSGCDCSNHYGSMIMANPLLNRLDRFALDGSNNTEFHDADGFGGAVGEFPLGMQVASRGFLPPNPSAGPNNPDPTSWHTVAQNFRFIVITTMFHNYAAPDGWTFETKDQYPVG
ncbi:MAG: hypothetical protein QOC71_693, partial [Thermoplasmata archaeon]|nr:hypothetical protein [Thermoplasmata archaeon]